MYRIVTSNILTGNTRSYYFSRFLIQPQFLLTRFQTQRPHAGLNHLWKAARLLGSMPARGTSSALFIVRITWSSRPMIKESHKRNLYLICED
jgi:hypothetical protein